MVQVAVRQLAAKQAQVLLGGDFCGHLFPVCGLASDAVTGNIMCMIVCLYVCRLACLYMCGVSTDSKALIPDCFE